MPTESKKKNNIAYLTYLRAAACIAIVFLHGSLLVGQAFTLDPAQGRAALIVRNAMLWAVPCFAMVTGVLLLDPAREMSLKKIFGRYVLRILQALFLFTLVYEICDEAIGGQLRSLPALLRSWLVRTVTGTSWSTLWYLYMVIAIYLLLPFYRMISAQAKKQDLRYLLLMYLIFQSLVPLLRTVTGSSIGFYICTYTIYPLYLFLGWQFGRKENVRMSPVLLLILTAALTILLMVLTGIGWNRNQSVLLGLLSDYSFLPVIVQSQLVFLIFRRVFGKETGTGWSGEGTGTCQSRAGNRNGQTAAEAGINRSEAAPRPKNEKAVFRILTGIDRCSFGIYLIHVLYFHIIYFGMGVNPLKAGLPVLLLLDVLVFCLSYVTIRALKKLPWLGRIL